MNKELEELAEQEFNDRLFQNCQQRYQFYLALVRRRKPRNEGNSLLTSTIFDPSEPFPYTQEQLNMRRKAEILQYTGPSTQGGRRESILNQFSRINRTSGYATRLANLNADNLSNCSSNKFIPRATTDSDVPGPPILLAYDPKVTLVGMPQHTSQNEVAADNLPDFDAVLSETNASVVKYRPYSYRVRDVSSVTLSMASITFIMMNPKVNLTATIEFGLEMEFAYTVIDTNLASMLLTDVHYMMLNVKSVQPIIYYFSEPQRYDSTYIILVPPTEKLLEKSTGKIQLSPGTFVERYSLADAGTTLTFDVTDLDRNIQALQQQTDRLSLNVDFDLFVFDFFETPINPALKINVTDISITFKMIPTDAYFTYGYE
jgi:hypothetical protein